MPIQSFNPATGELLQQFQEISDTELETKLVTADEQARLWRKTSFAERKKLMLNLAELFRNESREIGMLATLEMGKPIAQAKAEVEKSAWVCEYYANNAETILKKETVETDASESYVQFDPLGIVFAVMPWNYPFWQVLRFIAPAAMAGNVGVLKHASNVPQCSLKIEELFVRAGFPTGVFQSVLIASSRVESIIKDPRIKAVTLTGSEYAGSQVAMHAGREIKKTVLELGGSDPFIVLEDADLEKALSTAVNARLQNAGQSCIAAKRFILHETIAEEFIAGFKERFEALRVGNPQDEATDIGPVVDMKSLEEIDRQVQDSVAAGAEIVTGGKRVGESGSFYAPTIIRNLKKGMPAYDQEIFGPVASVIVVQNTEEAIAVANDTPFGLGSSVWTNDLEKAKAIIPQIDAGAVFVNGMVKSDPRLPFGGVKKSGYGRELSHYGMKEFVNVKTVWMQKV